MCLRVWKASGEAHRGYTLGVVKRRTRLLLRSARNLEVLRRWHARPAGGTLGEMLRRHPLAPVLREQPYINASWATYNRMRLLEAHYQLLAGPLAGLRFPLDEQVDLADLSDVRSDLRLVLDQPEWFRHEGELALNVFLGGKRLYSLLFTVGLPQGQRVAFVGALQGSAGESALDTYRELTHACHGMRPRDLLVTAFRQLCAELGVERILAVSDAQSARRSAYFIGADDVHFSYDSAWAELRGVPADGGFFELPVEVPPRTQEEIPSRKRAQYRRRYAMADAMRAQVGATLRERAAAAQAGSAPVPRNSALLDGVATCTSTLLALGHYFETLRLAF